MKRFYGAILFFIAFLSLGSVHAANSIDALNMDIFINASGDAHVIEVWNCYATKDTEWYHTYKNVGRSEAKNLVVKDEHNDFFETLTSLDEMFENFKLNLAADLTGYGLGICMIVGTVALFLKILGFNTEKWALLAGAVFLFILLTF